MPKRSPLLMLSAAVSVLLGACTLNAGSKAVGEFEEHFRTAYPQDVVGFDTTWSNDMPTLGTLAGAVLLRPEASAEVFDAVLAEVEGFEPSVRVYYRPLGVVANGLGICVDDEQREAKRALREALRQGGQSLGGTWGCRGPRYDAAPVYEGDVHTFMADTELVRPHLTTGPDLQLSAMLTNPPGSANGPWSQVPSTLRATLDRIGAEQVITRFGLSGSELRVAIEPTADLAAVQAAAEEAAGPDLTVVVLPGSLDAARATAYTRLGPIVDELRAQPGVTAVTTSSTRVEVTVESPEAAVAVHDVARAMPEFRRDTHLGIVVGEDWLTGSRYEVTALAEGGHVELFAELVGMEGMESVSLREAMATQGFWLRLNIEEELTTMLSRVAPRLPDGLRVELYRPGHPGTVRLTTAPVLDEADLTLYHVEGVTASELAQAWNDAAP